MDQKILIFLYSVRRFDVQTILDHVKTIQSPGFTRTHTCTHVRTHARTHRLKPFRFDMRQEWSLVVSCLQCTARNSSFRFFDDKHIVFFNRNCLFQSQFCFDTNYIMASWGGMHKALVFRVVSSKEVRQICRTGFYEFNSFSSKATNHLRSSF